MRLTDIRAISTVLHDGRPAVGVRIKTEKAEAWSEVLTNKAAELAEVVNQNAAKFLGLQIVKLDDLWQLEKVLPRGPALVAAQSAALGTWSAERQRPLWKILNPNSKQINEVFVNVGRTEDITEILLRANQNLSGTATLAKASALDLSGLSAFDAIRRVEKTLGAAGHSIGIDLEAHRMMRSGKYFWRNFNGHSLNVDAKKHAEMVSELVHHFDIKYIEDPLHKNAFYELASLHKKLVRYGHRHVCGDHLVRGDLARARIAKKHGSVNALLIDLEKSGSILSAKKLFDFCKSNNLTPVMRINNAVTANLALAWQAPIAKATMSGFNELNKLGKDF